MRIRHRFANFDQNIEQLVTIDLRILLLMEVFEQQVERTPLNHLHEHKWLTLRSHTTLINRRNSRMIKLRSNLDFTLETQQSFALLRILNKLQSRLTFESPIINSPHFPHATTTKQLAFLKNMQDVRR